MNANEITPAELRETASAIDALARIEQGYIAVQGTLTVKDSNRHLIGKIKVDAYTATFHPAGATK